MSALLPAGIISGSLRSQSRVADTFLQKINQDSFGDDEINEVFPEFLKLVREALNTNDSKDLENLLTHPKVKDRVLFCSNQLLVRPFLRRDFDGRIFHRISDSKFETIPLTLKQSGMIPASIPRLDQEPLDPSHSQVAPDFKEDGTKFYAIIPDLRRAIDEKNKDAIDRLCALPECRDRMFFLQDTLILRRFLYRDSDGTPYLRSSNHDFFVMYLDPTEAALFTSTPRVDSYYSGPGGNRVISAGEYDLSKILHAPAYEA